MKEQGLAKRVKLLNNDEVTICLRLLHNYCDDVIFTSSSSRVQRS